MRLSPLLALGASTLNHLASAVPVQDSPRQRLLDGKPLPARYRKANNNPYTPGHRDPYDSAVDAIGEGLDPLPYRNGLGASVLGPWNPDRARQNADLVRPPSTDHGNMPNLRWSFVDSHIRIEVRTFVPGMLSTYVMQPRLTIPRKEAGHDKPPSVNSPPASS